MHEVSGENSVKISWKKVAAFRLARHHLSLQRSLANLTSAAADMVGAQAQLLPAAQMSIWARVKGARIHDVESAIWKDHTLVKAWCMRRTLFLVPSSDLAIFARGTTRRAAYHLHYALSRLGSEQALDKLLDHVMEALKEPRTRAELAQILSKSHGYKIKSKPGGGWGNRRPVPWVEVRKSSIPVGQLFHIIAARDVICSGPSIGNESTYVRADKWIPHWEDIPTEEAEKELLTRYLRSFAPSTLTDFALWAGMYVHDAKEIWARETDNIVNVDVEGWKAGILRSDLDELKKAEIDQPVVRLLPFFDSFLLGHKSHRNIVDEKNQRKIYRPQGWVSPVLLVDGRAEGVWSHKQNKNNLEVRVTPLSKLPARALSQVREEAADLGRFLECSDVKTIIA